MNISRSSKTILALLVMTTSSIGHAGKNNQPKRLSARTILVATVLTALGIRYYSHDSYYYSTAPVHCNDFPIWDERPDHMMKEATEDIFVTDPNTIYCLQKRITPKISQKILAHIARDPQSPAYLYKEIVCDDFQPISCDSRSCLGGITDWQQSDDRGVEFSLVCLEDHYYDNDPLILKVQRSKSYKTLYYHIPE